jgi:hypothetical protein
LISDPTSNGMSVRCIRSAIAIAAAVVLAAAKQRRVRKRGQTQERNGIREARGNSELGRRQTGESNRNPVAATQRRVGERSKPRKRKPGGRFYELGIGARSAAGGMTPLSLTQNVREHRFQMHHYRGCAGDPLKN